MLLAWGCNSETTQNQTFELQSAWEYDSVSGDSVLLPLDNDFNDLVKSYLAQVKNDRIPEFMYDVYLDTNYHRFNSEGTHGRSLRAAVISQIDDRELLEEMLSDKRLNDVWSIAKRDSLMLRTNVEMIRDRLKTLKSEGGLPKNGGLSQKN